MLEAVLIVGALAGTQLRARRARVCAFWDLDQVAKLHRSKIDLDIQILKISFDSATAEVGPRSGIVEVERDLSHLFLHSRPPCGTKTRVMGDRRQSSDLAPGLPWVRAIWQNHSGRSGTPPESDRN